MKQNNINDKNIEKLTAQNIENLFNVYQNTDGTYFYNILKTVQFPEDLDPQLYSEYYVQPKDTWPLIAWKFYKDVKLWWIICALNNISNAVAQPEMGTKIKIISPNIVRSILTTIKEK